MSRTITEKISNDHPVQYLKTSVTIGFNHETFQTYCNISPNEKSVAQALLENQPSGTIEHCYRYGKHNNTYFTQSGQEKPLTHTFIREDNTVFAISNMDGATRLTQQNVIQGTESLTQDEMRHAQSMLKNEPDHTKLHRRKKYYREFLITETYDDGTKRSALVIMTHSFLRIRKEDRVAIYAMAENGVAQYGTSGKTKIGVNIDTNELVAIKISRKNFVKKKGDRIANTYQQELKAARATELLITHDKKIKKLTIEQPQDILVMRFFQMTLWDFFFNLLQKLPVVQKYNKTPDEMSDFPRNLLYFVVFLFRELNKLLKHQIVTLKFIHGDIKPANILINCVSQDEDDNINSFNFSTLKLEITYCDFETVHPISHPDAQVSGAVYGTPGYYPPEILDSTPVLYSQKSDIYSLGMTIYDLMVTTLKTIPHLSKTNSYQLLSLPLNTILHSMCANAPEHRPTLECIDAMFALILRKCSVTPFDDTTVACDIDLDALTSTLPIHTPIVFALLSQLMSAQILKKQEGGFFSNTFLQTLGIFEQDLLSDVPENSQRAQLLLSTLKTACFQYTQSVEKIFALHRMLDLSDMKTLSDWLAVQTSYVDAPITTLLILKKLPTQTEFSKTPLSTVLSVMKNLAKQTPIQLAETLGLWDCVEAIAKAVKTDTKDTAQYGWTLLHAASANQTDAVIALLNAGAHIDWYDTDTETYSIHCAVKHRNIAMLNAILAIYPAEIIRENKAEQTPIRLAAKLGFWDCVEAIAKAVKTDSKDTARYGSALVRAAFHNQTEVVIALIHANAPTSWSDTETENYPIHHAIQHNNVAMVSAILQKTLNDLERKNKNGQTPLQLAISLGYSEIANKISTVSELSSNIMAEAFEKRIEITSNEKHERAISINTFSQEMRVIKEKQKTREERLQLQQELIQQISILSSKITPKTDACCCMTFTFFKKNAHTSVCSDDIKEEEKRTLSAALILINQQIFTDEPATQEVMNIFNRELENNSAWKAGVFRKKTAQLIERSLAQPNQIRFFNH